MEKIVIRRPLKENILFIGGSLMFVAAGWWLLDEWRILGIICIIFFGGGGILYLALMSWKPILTISSEGVTVPHGFGSNFAAWPNIKKIEPFTQTIQASGVTTKQEYIGIWTYDSSNILGGGQASKQITSAVTNQDDVPCLLISAMINKNQNNIMAKLQEYHTKYGNNS